MSDDLTLERECRTFTRLFCRTDATPEVIAQYEAAHRHRPTLTPTDEWERRLVHIAASGPMAARLADAYARRRSPRGTLRKKLVLIFAILETARPFHRTVDVAPSRPWLLAVLGFAIDGVAGVAAAALAPIVVGPLLHGLNRAPRRP